MQFRFRSVLAFAGAAVCAASLAAQTSCPMQTTQHVPANITFGPTQACGGISATLPDLQVRIDGGRCPTFAVYVPPHDVAVPSQHQTYVEVVSQQPITMVTFECQTSWFLILPIGSECVASKSSTIGSVLSLVARPCQRPD